MCPRRADQLLLCAFSRAQAQNRQRHKRPILFPGTKSASSFKELSSKVRRGLVLDSVSNARGRLRYSVALAIVVFMDCSFRAVALRWVLWSGHAFLSAPGRERVKRVGSA